MKAMETPRFTGTRGVICDRQLEVLLWLAEGKTFAEVGLIMDMSLSTARTYLMRAGIKLNANSSKSSIIAAALCSGLVRVRAIAA